MESISFTRPNGSKIFQKLSNVAEFANLSAAAQLSYEQSLKAYRDNYAVEKTAHAEGHAEGLAKGRAEGRAEGLSEGRTEGMSIIIQAMRSKGMSDAEIADLTGLPLNEIINITRVN